MNMMRVIRRRLRRFKQKALGRLDMLEQDALEYHRLHGRARVETPQGKIKLGE